MKLRHLLVGFFACLAFIACDRDDDSQVSIDSGKGEETFLPIGDITVHPLGDALMMSYTSQYEWKLDYDGKGDWINISPASGKAGTTRIKIVVDPNLDQSRNAVIKFSNGGRVLDSFIATQYEAILDVTIDKAPQDDEDADIHEYKTDGAEKIKFDWKKSREGADFKVSSNIEWEIDIDDEVHYLLKDGNEDVLSRKYGSVADNPKDFPFGLHARNHNLSDNDTLRREITVSPRKVNKDGEEDSLPEDVVDSLTRTIEVTQEFLIFYLEGNDLVKNEENSDTYDFNRAFSELGNDYLSENEEADTAPGEQIFYLVYEEGKVDFSEGSWGALQKDQETVLENGDTLKCLSEGSVMKKLQSVEEDETERERKCVRKEMCLVVPDPNPNKLPEDVAADSTSKSVPLQLSVGEDVVSTITLNYSQYLYELKLESDSESYNFENNKPESSKTIKVITKGPWKIKKNENSGWLKVYKTETETETETETYKGDSRSTLILKAPDQNINFKSNEASLTLLTDFSESDDQELRAEQSLSFTQDAFEFYVDNESKLREAGELEITRINTSPHSVIFTSSGPWTLAVDKDWLIAKKEKYEEIDNYTYDFSEDDNELADKKKLTGEAGTWIVNMEAVSPNQDMANSRSVNITLTSDIHEKNELLDEDEFSDAKKTFTITQDKYVFNVSDDQLINKSIPAFDPNKNDPNKYSFVIDCGGPWRITSLPDWVAGIEVTKVGDNSWSPKNNYGVNCTDDGEISGDGMYSEVEITVTFKDNDGKQDLNGDNNPDYDWRNSRNGEIVVTSYKNEMTLPEQDYNGEVDTHSIPFTQDAFVFNVTGHENGFQFAAHSNDPKSFDIKCTEGAGWTITFDSESEHFGNEVSKPENYKSGDWVKFKNGNKGSGTETPEFSPQNNGYLSKRKIDVSVKSDVVHDSCTFTISQDPYVFEVSALDESADENDNNSLKIFNELSGNLEESRKISINTLGAWSISCLDEKGEEKKDWFKPNEDSGVGDQDVEITAINHSGNEVRSGKVRVTSEVGKSGEIGYCVHTKDFNVSQKNFVWSHNLPESIKLEALKDFGTTYQITSSGDWKPKLDDTDDIAAWPTKLLPDLNSDQYISGNRDESSNMTITVPQNYSTFERKVSVTVFSKDFPNILTKTLQITQDPYKFELSGFVPEDNYSAKTNTFSFDAGKHEATFAVDCTGEWDVDVPEDYQSILTASKSEDGKSVYVAINMHYDASKSRAVYFNVKTNDASALTKRINITQDPYKFELSGFAPKDNYSAETNTFSFDAGKHEATFDVICTGSWKVDPDKNAKMFLTIPEDGMSGKGDGTLTLTVQSNKAYEGAEATNDRTGTVTILTTDGSDKKETITIKQAGDKQ